MSIIIRTRKATQGDTRKQRVIPSCCEKFEPATQLTVSTSVYNPDMKNLLVYCNNCNAEIAEIFGGM